MTTLNIRMDNPFGRDLLPLDLNIDSAWLQQEMDATGRTAGECIADHIKQAIARDIANAAKVNRDYSNLLNDKSPMKGDLTATGK